MLFGPTLSNSAQASDPRGSRRHSNAVFPQMGQPMLHKGIAIVILGGMGDIRGALLGAFFLAFAEVCSVAYIGSTRLSA